MGGALVFSLSLWELNNFWDFGLLSLNTIFSLEAILFKQLFKDWKIGHVGYQAFKLLLGFLVQLEQVLLAVAVPLQVTSCLSLSFGFSTDASPPSGCPFISFWLSGLAFSFLKNSVISLTFWSRIILLPFAGGMNFSFVPLSPWN